MGEREGEGQTKEGHRGGVGGGELHKDDVYRKVNGSTF